MRFWTSTTSLGLVDENLVGQVGFPFQFGAHVLIPGGREGGVNAGIARIVIRAGRPRVLVDPHDAAVVAADDAVLDGDLQALGHFRGPGPAPLHQREARVIGRSVSQYRAENICGCHRILHGEIDPHAADW